MGQSVSRGFSGAQVFSTYGAAKGASKPAGSNVFANAYDDWQTFVLPADTVTQPAYDEYHFFKVVHSTLPCGVELYTGPGTDFESCVLEASSVTPVFTGADCAVIRKSITSDVLYFLWSFVETTQTPNTEFVSTVIRERDVAKITKSEFDSNGYFKLTLQAVNPSSPSMGASVSIYGNQTLTGTWTKLGTVSYTGSGEATFTDTITPVNGVLPSVMYYRTEYHDTIVGYASKTLTSGWNLVANPFEPWENRLDKIVKLVGTGSTYFMFNGDQTQYWPSGTHAWSVGEGAWASATSIGTLRVHGKVKGSTNRTVPTGDSLVGTALCAESMAFPGVEELTVYRWNSQNQAYYQGSTYEFGAWSNGTPAVSLVEGAKVSTSTAFSLNA